jgi:hypothetical protein
MTLRVGLFVGLNALIFAGFHLWLARRRWSLLDTVVGAYLLLLGQVLCVQMLLARLGHLKLWEIVGAHIVLSAGVWAWTGKDVASSAEWTRRELRRLCRAMTWYSWIALALVAVVLVWTAAVVVHIPCFNWDANMYHIPIAALRLQKGNLERLESGWAWIEAYPEAGEMLILWNLLFLESQVLADAVQWPFWLFGMLALVSLATKMGAKVPHAVLGSTVWMFAPVAMLQARNAGNDLIVASLFWMGMNFVYQRPVTRISVSLAGVAAGLLLGTKLGAVWLIIVLGVFTIWNVMRASNKRSVAVAILAVWVAFGLLNAYWYLSNWRHTGNPIWPVGASAGPLAFRGSFSLDEYEVSYTPPLLAGKPVWQQLWLVWLETESRYAEAAKLTGFGPLWIVLGIPSIVVWLGLEQRGWPLVLTSLVPLIGQSLAWHTRYTLFLPGLGAIALAVVLSHLRASLRVCTKLVLLAGAVFSFLVVLDVHKINYMRMPQAYRAPVYSGWPLLGGAYRWLDANTRTPARVVYGGPVAFLAPLWGEDLRHTVDYIRPSDRDSWEPAVLAKGTEWAFVVIDSVEDKLLASSSQFALVVDDRRFESPASLPSRVYRVVKEGSGE